MTDHNSFPAPSTTIHLQYVGEHHALIVSELTVGCVTVWNGGGLYVVTNIEEASKCFAAVTMAKVEYAVAGGYSVSNHDLWVRKMKTSRAIGYSPKATAALAAQQVKAA